MTIVNALRIWLKLRMLIIHYRLWLLMLIRYTNSLQISRILHLRINLTILESSRINLLLRLTFKKFGIRLLLIRRNNSLLLLLLPLQLLVVSKLI
jgi:hypothetical protein